MRGFSFFFIYLLFGILSCGKEASNLDFQMRQQITSKNAIISDEAPLGFRALQKFILEPKCMSCHSGEDAEPSNDPIDFSSYETTTMDRFIPLLIKGKANKSRLYKEVQNGDMPISGMLHQKEIEFIKAWIDACAPKEDIHTIPEECKEDDGDDDDFGDDEF